MLAFRIPFRSRSWADFSNHYFVCVEEEYIKDLCSSSSFEIPSSKCYEYSTINMTDPVFHHQSHRGFRSQNGPNGCQVNARKSHEFFRHRIPPTFCSAGSQPYLRLTSPGALRGALRSTVRGSTWCAIWDAMPGVWGAVGGAVPGAP